MVENRKKTANIADCAFDFYNKNLKLISISVFLELKSWQPSYSQLHYKNCLTCLRKKKMHWGCHFIPLRNEHEFCDAASIEGINCFEESHSKNGNRRRAPMQLGDPYHMEVRAEPSYPPNTNGWVVEESGFLSFMPQRRRQPAEK